jgi:hypothetical protein
MKLLTLDVEDDQRDAFRQVNGDKDWAKGYFKLECGSGQYVQGVSQNAAICQNNHRFHAIRCAEGEGLLDAGCSTRVFDTKSDRGNLASEDWDFGAWKGECAVNEYVAGVSVEPSSLFLHSLLCCPTKASPASDAPYYGISPDQKSFDASQAGTLRDLGAEIVRLQICDWPSTKSEFRSMVDAALAKGLKVHAEINYCTLRNAYPDTVSWHEGFTDADGQGNAFAKAFIAAAGEIAKAFAGDVYVYEIWNEPNASPQPDTFPNPFWADADNADWDGSCSAYVYGAEYKQSSWALCPRQLGVISAGAYDAITDADPTARLVAANLFHHGEDGWVAREYYKVLDASPAVTRYRDDHGRRPWDFVGYHPYGQSPLNDGSLGSELGNQLDKMADALAGRSDPSPIAITEYGWATEDIGDDHYEATEAGQAAMLPAAFEVARQRGVAFFTWFNYLDGIVEGQLLSFGIRKMDLEWKPAAKAYCQATGTTSCPVP